MVPKNIRQIGEGDTSIKVYIEDYVITFLKQIQKKLSGTAQSVSLCGEKFEKDGYSYFIIRGAVLTEKDKEQYFPGAYFLGQAVLVNAQRSIGDLASAANILTEHKTKEAVYFEISKPEEDLRTGGQNDIFDYSNMFFLNNGKLEAVSVYYIFYEKNDSMQDYLIDWNEKREGQHTEASKDRAVTTFRKTYQDKQEFMLQKKLMVCVYSLSTCLLIISCVIGISAMNSYDKMKKLEVAMNHLVIVMDEKKETMQNAPVLETDTQTVIVRESKDKAELSTSAELEAIQEGSSPETDNGTKEQTSLVEEEQQAVQKTTVETIQVQKEYVIKEGDTLANISRKFYQTADKVQEICDLNQIADPNKIVIGQKILLPE